MPNTDVNKPGAIFAAILLSVVGVSNFMIQPLFLGSLADDLGFDHRQIGIIAGAEVAGTALAGLIAVTWIRRFNWRVVAAIAIGVVVAGNLLSSLVTDFPAMLAVRFVMSLLGHGNVYALAVAAVSATRETERNFAFAVVGQVSYAIVGLLLMPYLTPQWGTAGIVLPIAAFAVLSLPFVYWLPMRHRATDAAVATAAGEDSKTLVWIGLGIHLLWYVGVGAVWAFVERLGVEAGLAHTAIGQALAIAMAVGLAGAFAATIAGHRYGRIVPFAVAMMGQVFALRLLAGQPDYAAYVGAVCVYNLTWNLALPYLLGLIAKADTTGRFSVLIPTAQAAGVSLGPVVAGLAVGGIGLQVVLYLGSATALLALAIYIPLARRIG